MFVKPLWKTFHVFPEAQLLIHSLCFYKSRVYKNINLKLAENFKNMPSLRFGKKIIRTSLFVNSQLHFLYYLTL